MSFEEWATVDNPEHGVLIMFFILDVMFIIECVYSPGLLLIQLIGMSIINFIFGVWWYKFVCMKKNYNIKNELYNLLRKTKINIETKDTLDRLLANPDEYFVNKK